MFVKRLHVLATILSIGVVSDYAIAQNTQQGNLQDQYQIDITQTTEPVNIDGHLRESFWKDADVATHFWMSFPQDDRRVEEAFQTEVRVAYDKQFLYVSAVCHDKPGYIIPSLKRDNPEFWRGDAFGVAIDPVNERQSGFSFGVNPENVQTESLITGQTGRRGDQRPGRPPTGINSAWDNKWYSAVTTAGDQWIVEIAIPFKTLRFDPTRTTWGINFFRGEPSTNSYHTWSPVPVQFRAVDLGYTGALKWDQAPEKVNGNISLIPYGLVSNFQDFEEGTPNEFKARVGMDAKVALSSNLNLDITLNPDFSQVDVDEQVTNLTAFSIRFPERRLFFLENSDVFQDFGIPPMRPFFSRRIGLDEDGNTIPILYGLRLSGNLNKDLRIGAMNLQTKSSDAGPAQNYTSLAMHQRIFGRTVLKGFFHNRQGFSDGELQMDNFNRIGGLEYSHQSLDGKFRTFGGYNLSFVDELKNDRENYFYSIAVGYDNKNISFYSNLAEVGDLYYSDVGFIPTHDHYDAVRDTSFHIGFKHWFSRLAYTHFTENDPIILSHSLGLRNVYNSQNDWDTFRQNLEIQYQLRFKNTSSAQLSYNINLAELLFPFDFTDEEPLPAGTYHYNNVEVVYQTDQRKVLRFRAGLQYGDFYNGTVRQYSLSTRYRVQPWGNFDLNFTLSNLDFPELYGSEQLFLISPRVEINFNTNIFWTTFLQYNTQSDNFNINSRLQWRYQPMSDLFIVYSDNYAVDFFGPKNRALVVKLNYWLNL